VSNKTRALFEKLCPRAFDFYPAVVKVRDRDGQDNEVPGYQLCDVIDFQDNIDVTRSEVVWRKAMPKFFENYTYKVSFKGACYPEFLCYREKWWPELVVCSRGFKAAVEQEGLTGLAFIPFRATD
jgi:hypothetical protein